MGTATEASFEVVKNYVTADFPELYKIKLKECPDCEKMYQESKTEQAKKGLPPRVYAHTYHFPETICYSKRMDTELSEEERQGILIHEFGHIYNKKHPDDASLYKEDIEMWADVIVFLRFKVVIDYNDREIEAVNLPLGSDEVSDDDISAVLAFRVPELSNCDEDEDEDNIIIESNESWPVPRENPVIDTEIEDNTGKEE